ncbi:MAG: hypothetical protein FWG99_06505 [Treponema sp.]|nr:hypothetical protein [Treponema sp.]
MKRKIFILVLLVIAMTGSLFAQIHQDDIWKNKKLYIGGSFGLGPIMGSDGTVLGGNLSPLQLNWQMTKYLSLGTGLNFYFGPQTKYTAPKQTDKSSGILETYSGMETHIIFPLLLEATLRPNNFSIEFGGGLYVAPVVMNTTVERTNNNGYTFSEGYGKNLFTADSNNPFGFIATGSFGVKAGRGILFLNMRYLRDFSEVTVKFNGEKIGSHLWNMIDFCIGYKYGFFSI